MIEKKLTKDDAERHAKWLQGHRFIVSVTPDPVMPTPFYDGYIITIHGYYSDREEDESAAPDNER